jgi:LysR family transcriptional regulator for metE and metH
MLEIKHLITLQTLAETHSVNLAAQRLCLTQSALSHQIKQLEALLNLKLFERKTHPVEFTPAGQTLLQAAQEILPKLRHTEQTLKALAQGELGRLLIGVDCHTCFEWLLPMLRQYQQKWPGVDLDILNALGDQPLKKLQQQQLDLVITSDPEQLSDLRYDALFSYELVCVLPPEHVLCAKQWLEPADFAQHTLISYPVPRDKLDVFRRFLHPAHMEPKALRHSELTLMMLQLVDSNRGLCVLPKWLIQSQPEFRHLPIRSLGKEGLWSTLYAATHSQQTQPYIQDFIHQVANKMTL